MKIDITVEMPDQVRDEHKHQSIMDKCCDYMTHCESDEQSEYHWKYLKAVYKKLSKAKNLNPMMMELLEKLEEFVLKHDSDRASLDAQDMFKYYND